VGALWIPFGCRKKARGFGTKPKGKAQLQKKTNVEHWEEGGKSEATKKFPRIST